MSKGRRSGEAVAARSRNSAGPMRHRLEPRGGARNNHANYLDSDGDNSCCEVPQGAYVDGEEMTTPFQVTEIIAQLGGPKIFAMAFKSCAYATSPKTQVTFAVAPALKRAAKCSHVRVTLDPSDTYTVEFLKVAKFDCKTVSEVGDVYCDQLKELVEKTTGLYLSL
jgi:hypothetical protein